MTETEENDIRESLFLSYGYIVEQLSDEKRVENQKYRVLATILRSLLLDKECPILLYYANINNYPLSIVSYSDVSTIPDADHCILSIDNAATLPHWPANLDGRLFSIEQYLDTPIGIVPAKSGKKAGHTYTPKQVIKWVSQKDGIAHFDLKKPEAYSSLKGVVAFREGIKIDGFLMQNIIFSLSKWASTAIIFVLSPSILKTQAEAYYKEHSGEDIIEYANTNRIAHYQPIWQSFRQSILDGEHCYVAKDLNKIYYDYLTFSMLLMFPDTKITSKQYIFCTKIQQHSDFIIGLYIDQARRLILCINNGADYEYCILDKIQYWTYGVLTISIDLPNNEIVVFQNSNILIVINLLNLFSSSEYTYCSQTLGSDYNKANKGIFLIAEDLIMNTKMRSDNIRSLENRMWIALANGSV